MGAMANGLFASLLVGTIVKTLGQQVGNLVDNAFIDQLAAALVAMGDFASAASGCAMAIAIGYALKADPLVLFSLATVGYATNSLGGAGGPLAVLIIAIVASEVGMLVSKKTKIDVLVTPIVTIVVGCALALLISKPIGDCAKALGEIIVWATVQQPVIMGVVISVVMGMILTLPISSAAICASFGVVGLAGGAAVAGCCAQMIGFAVISYRENRLGGLVAQGLGTSMLQVPNIVKNPRIWIAPTLASAVTGPLATVVFKLEMNGAAVSSGMGTCGMVGPIGVISGWFNPLAASATPIIPTAFDWIGLILICIVLPALLSWIFNEILRKVGWVRDGDMKLSV
ncbi:MAG: PTS sugar transporter subunit IIC [Oscillospiraceae bacterium]|nr:PTS sugar transporter subunit IIC [Oscillospiraceae bacterium]